jgi:hypothetical protein
MRTTRPPHRAPSCPEPSCSCMRLQHTHTKRQVHMSANARYSEYGTPTPPSGDIYKTHGRWEFGRGGSSEIHGFFDYTFLNSSEGARLWRQRPAFSLAFRVAFKNTERWATATVAQHKHRRAHGRGQVPPYCPGPATWRGVGRRRQLRQRTLGAVAFTQAATQRQQAAFCIAGCAFGNAPSNNSKLAQQHM